VYPKLTPIISPWIEDILQHPKLLQKLVRQYDSPLNLHNPTVLAENINQFQIVLKRHLAKSKVFFARKPNSCISFVQKAIELNIGIDVASFEELQQSLEYYCPPKNLVITAAIKDDNLCRLATKHQILTTVDNFDELQKLSIEANKQGKSLPIALRVSGFYFQGKKSYSRFGFDLDQLDEVFHKLHQQPYSNLDFKGFHFHLNGYSLAERAEAICQLFDVIIKIRVLGFHTTFIDIGGGFLVQYLKSAREWKVFHRELKKAILSKRTPITYQNQGLCYLRHGQELINLHNLYPYYNQLSKADALETILTTKKGTKTIAKLLNEEKLELRIEPGRSALDQCGMTIAKVVHTKEDSQGNTLVGLKMNFTQLLSSSSEFALDPVVLYASKHLSSQPTGCYFVGAYCMERDVILKRKIVLTQKPAAGDLVCFINTAAYMMHFLAAKSHQFPSAKNVVISQLNDGFKFVLDPLETYK